MVVPFPVVPVPENDCCCDSGEDTAGDHNTSPDPPLVLVEGGNGTESDNAPRRCPFLAAAAGGGARFDPVPGPGVLLPDPDADIDTGPTVTGALVLGRCANACRPDPDPDPDPGLDNGPGPGKRNCV